MESFILERIEENKDLFTTKEFDTIQKNKEIVKKIYMLAIINFNAI